jgi:sugar lactone lactonase YvrE
MRASSAGRLLVIAAVLIGMLVTALPAASGGGSSSPETIPLPPGFRPEGIAAGKGDSLYVGSIGTGAVWRGSSRTGEGAVLVPPHEGRAAIGIEVDPRQRIFVAGGPTGDAFVYNARNGRDIAAFELAPPGADTFINDVAVTRRAAYFTDSRIAMLWSLKLGRRGQLPRRPSAVPLTGDITNEAGNNANGIVAARGGKVLIVVQSNTGKLFRVNPKSGRAREISLGGASVVNGDGLLLRGRTLYVVQNRDNKIAVVRLRRGLGSGRVTGELTNPAFDVPTTLARSRGSLWTVNARFTTPPMPDTEYDIVRVR